MSDSRYVIGIDLGTTNTAVCHVDMRSADRRVQVFPVPQLVAPGELAPQTQLPSFVYLPGAHDLSPQQTALPWDETRRHVVGILARGEGARQPQRMVASSKSWLCHAGVDRHAKILPWGAQEARPKRQEERQEEPQGEEQGEAARRLSPVEASSLILAHVAEAWNHVHKDEESAFARQDVIITVPASFDEAARELTLEAAHACGIKNIVLLEEPQAAFYAWTNDHTVPAARESLSPDDVVLVFDVGGGTTDFTIISVDASGQGFKRIAVGDHLLLGGDNMDLTLAKRLEARLGERGESKLDPIRWQALVHACRLAKERLLSDSALASTPVTMPGRGTRLIGGATSIDLSRTDLEQMLFEGFFPLVSRDEPRKRTRSGLQEFGLPYAADPAITRHAGTFLTRHGIQRVDAVLFNGGVMAPAELRTRVLEQIAYWQPDRAAPKALTSPHPALAVAEGAAHYGLVRRGLGRRIAGGTAHSFYVGVGRADGVQQAVCLAPRGLEEGATVELQRDLRLLTNRPVSFKLYSSTTRADEPGAIVDVGDGSPETLDDGSDLLELPPIVTVARAPGRGEVTVHLEVQVTELGTLEIGCKETAPSAAPLRWALTFDMRAGGARRDDQERDREAGTPTTEQPERVIQAQQLIRDVFTGKPDLLASMIKQIEQILEQPRDEWSMGTARALFDATFEVVQARKQSPQHEVRWLNLAGYCLRPGVGAPADDWRSKQMWGVVFHEELVHPRSEECRLAWWITWRRIAGGLTNGQQHQLYLRLAQLFLPGKKGKKRWDEIKPRPQEAAEMLRCLGNLERCTTDEKAALGDELVGRMSESKRIRAEALYFWVVGRLGARVPLYGPLNAVVPAVKVQAWIETLLGLDWPDPAKAAFPMAQLGRRTDDRSRDIEDTVRTRLIERLRGIEGAERSATLVEDVVELQSREEYIALGDSLPAGLRLMSDQPERFSPPRPGGIGVAASHCDRTGGHE